MKITLFILSVVLSLGGISTAQSSEPTPAASMRRAQELELQNERDWPPAIRRSVNPASLQNQANQLADLAATVPQGVQNVNKGMLEKDLIHRLKQIEKLSKQLRNQLDH